MNLNDIDKYGFPFLWFIDTYDKINGFGSALNLNIIKNKIKKFYDLNYLNYSKFIDKIEFLLNISPSNKIEYLEKEEKCKLCEKNYPHSFEIFREFIDFQTNKKINSKICFDCAHTQYFCSNCNFNLNNEPYEQIYIYADENNKNNFLTICKLCYKDKNNIPLISLLYKNVKISIEFCDLK